MASSKPVTTLSTGKRGRPASVRKRAVFLIGSGNMKALDEAGLAIVPAALVSELALFVNEPIPAGDIPAPATD